MIVTKDYQNAFAEVSTILSYIEENEYNKIPKNVISVIEQNKNTDYEYEMNDELDIFSQPMLAETKAILYNFFRDYWATEEQRNKIKAFQNNKRHQIEEENRQKYNTDIFKNRKSTFNEIKNEQAENIQLIEYKENIFRRILGILRKMFGK